MPPSLSIERRRVLGISRSNTNPGTPVEALVGQTVRQMTAGMGGHYGYPHFERSRIKDVGGAFFLTGREYDLNVQDVGELYRGGPLDESYVGALAFTVPSPVLGALPTGDASVRGAEAFKRMKPTKPVFSVLNSLYELRELPDLVFLLKGKIENLKGLGELHLTGQFGILPILSDVKKLITIQQDTEKRLNQLLRDNGRPIRRKLILADTSTDPVLEHSASDTLAVMPGFTTQFYAKTPSWDRSTVFNEKYWASAQFRYWLPPGPQGIVYKQRLRRLLQGASYPTAAQLYNAIPWTWLIDWFSNLGDVVDNLEVTIVDRLAADHFYLMRHFERVITQTSNVSFRRRNGAVVSFSGTSSSHKFTKQRVRGDPFGINTNENLLTGSQLSILGALGLSRLR